MSGSYDPNDPVQFKWAEFTLMSRFDGFYENLVNQGVDPQTAYMQVRLKTANHPWFPSKLALANAGNPALIRYDPGHDAQGRSSPNGVAFGPILNNIPGRSVPYDGLFETDNLKNR